MAVMELVLVRGDRVDAPDPYPMQGIELEASAGSVGLVRAPRLEMHPEDYAWEIMGGEGIIFTEVVYHPRLLPERLVVRAPEGGELKTTFELARELGALLGANVFNLTTGEEIAHHFPGETAAEKQRAMEQEALEARKGCLGGLFSR